MAVELITGVGASDHISSNDFRAFNRANFGQGRYILNDADNMEVNVSAPAGIISISEGSCMWSGMHIRLSSAEQIRYTVPSSAQMIYVYLHYTKDASTGVESVDFEVKQGIKLSSTTDNLDDNTLDAYTLFCSFAAYPTSASDITVFFKTIKSHEELENAVATSQDEVVLFDGDIVPGTINISENMNNFKFIIFEYRGGDAYCHALFSADHIYENFAVSIVGNDKWGNKASLFTSIANIFAKKIGDTQIRILYTSRVLLDTSVQSMYGSDGVSLPIRIIGKERKPS